MNNGHTETVKLLLDNGANIYAYNNYYTFNWAAINRHTEVVKLLKSYIKKDRNGSN